MCIKSAKVKVICTGLFFLSSVSCSVREPRDGGPCTLYEDSGDMNPLTVSLWCEGMCLDEVFSREPRVFEFTLERGGVLVTALTGASLSSYRDGVLSLAGEAAVDSVFAYRDSVDCSGEWMRDTVARHKQFATVTMSLNISPRHERFPDSLRIISAWGGLDVRTMEAVRGSYGHTIVCMGIEQSFRILRQGDDSLILRLISRTDGIIDDVPLGRLLQQAGYSWKDDDLEDIEIGVDEASSKIRIIINNWIGGDQVILEI